MIKTGDYWYERSDVVSQAVWILSEKLSPTPLRALCTHNKKTHAGEVLGRQNNKQKEYN